MKRILTAMLAIVAAVSLMAGVASADIDENYESAMASYGDKASSYEWTVQVGETPVRVVYIDSFPLTVQTSVNIRSLPSPEADKIYTAETTDKIKAWALADNGWCQVMCQGTDGMYYFGFMKKEYLFHA